MKQTVKYDALLILAVLASALVLWLLLRPGGAGTWVVVEQNGRETARYPLAQDRTITLGEGQYNILEIKNGAAAVIEANCGDHTCVRTGSVSRAGETIVCLPHRLIIRIQGGEASSFDAAAR